MSRRAVAGTISLIGDPVAHSVSPAMHRAGFAAAGLDGMDYVATRVTVDELPGVFGSLRGRFVGLNVTTPLKELVLRLGLVDRADREVASTGSVNTVVFAGGDVRAHSTDGPGFLAALRRAGVAASRRALVLGAGGASRAVAGALLSAGGKVAVAARDPGKGRMMRSRFGADVEVVPFEVDRKTLQRCDLVVNATPLGGPGMEHRSPLQDPEALSPGATVFDLVYRPRRTLLLRQAEEAGCRTVEGIEMLIEQGVRSFALWTGVDGPVEVMRAAAYRAMDEPAEVVR